MPLKPPAPTPRTGMRPSLKRILSVSNLTVANNQHYYELKVESDGDFVATPRAKSTYFNLSHVKEADVENPIYHNVGYKGDIDEVTIPEESNDTTNENEIPQNNVCGNPLYQQVEESGPNIITTDNADEKWLNTVVNVLCIMYIILMTIFGITVYLADGLNIIYKKIKTNHSSYFNLYMSLVLLCWLIFIHVDILRFLNYVGNKLKEARSRSLKEGKPLTDINSAQNEAQRDQIYIPELYGFTSGRHAGSNYLKFGAIIFYLGHFMHSMVMLGKEALNYNNSNCNSNVIEIILGVLQPIVSTYILYFVISYSNLIINRFIYLSKFGLSHCLASSFCFWIHSIVEETLLAISLSKEKPKTDSTLNDRNIEARFLACEDSHYKIQEDFEILDKMTPYFYPFSIEFNILIVSAWILLMENIGKVNLNVHKISTSKQSAKFKNPLNTISIDCTNTKGGMFLGGIINAIAVVTVIFFFTLTKKTENGTTLGITIMVSFEGLLIVCSIGMIVYAIFVILKLDVMKQSISMVEDICLLACLPCIFLYTSLTVVPHFHDGNYISVFLDILIGLHPILQTVLIVIGLRRCSNSETLQTNLPGRNVFALLLLLNIALWIIETFQIKNKEGNEVFNNFYGKMAWTLFSHATLPLLLFFYFHSSVCLADIWKTAYQPEQHH